MYRPVLLCLALVTAILSHTVAPLTALAEGESDPLWNQSTYDKKINNIGQRILAANGISERIFFIYSRTHEINATATRSGGNHIMVYHDLLTRMDSDDELAAVLSHEIAHITLRHGTDVTATRVGMRALLVAAAMAAPYTVGVATPSIGKFAHAAPTAVSRGNEKEADLAGLDYLVKAGYNPLAMETLMNKIAMDGSLRTRFFSDHPMGTDRLQYIHTAIINRYPQFLTEQTRNNPVPGSPYQMQEPNIPRRTVYANPPGPAPQAIGINPAFNPGSSNQPNIGRVPGNFPNLSTSFQARNTASPSQSNQTAPNSQVAYNPALPGNPVAMMALVSKPVDSANPTVSRMNASAQNAGTIADTPSNKTLLTTLSATMAKPSQLPPPPQHMNYKTTTLVKTQPQSTQTFHGHHTGNHTTTSHGHPNSHANATGMTASPNLTGTTITPAPSGMSVAQTLLGLNPDALRLVRLVSQRGTLSHQDMVIEFEALDEDVLNAMLLDLQNNKNLISIQGNDNNATYTLTPRAARVLRPH